MSDSLHAETHLTTPARNGNALNPPPFRPLDTSQLCVGNRLDSYEILEKLGGGGMGVVFRVRHVVLKKEFALKALSPRLACDEDSVARFRREAEALGRLEHPHLVRASDAGVADSTPFLVMELLDGVDLAERTKQRGPWPVAEACEAIRQAAVGLQHAHERGLVHRDIKPSNLWRTRNGVVKVLDLGLARLCLESDDEALTRCGIGMGTPDFMAPEQIVDSHSVDIRADLYSLGCTLFHLLAAVPPFGDAEHSTVRRKREAHLSEAPPDICSLRADVPAELQAVLAKLLAKKAEDRFATPAEVAEALTPFAQGTHLEPTPIKDTPAMSLPSTQLSPTPRRRRWWALAGGLLLAVAFAAAILLMRRDEPQPVISADPVAGKLQVLSLEIKHFANVERNGKKFDQVRGALGKNSFAAQRRDSVTVEARLSRPAYAFLIAFRPDGVEEVCFPENEDEAPPLTDRPCYPSVSRGDNYGLDEGEGLQAFALVASSRPLPSYKTWRAECGASPWSKSAASPGVVWRDDGEEIQTLTGEVDRGKGREVSGKTAVAKLASWLRKTPGVETVRIIGFAVTPKKKR